MEKLDNILHKPLLYKESESNQTIIVIYSYDKIISKNINIAGVDNNKIYYVVYFIYINSTLSYNRPDVGKKEIHDINAFLDCLVELDLKEQNSKIPLFSTQKIILSEMNVLLSNIHEYSSICASLNKILSNKENLGRIVLQGTTSFLANIPIKTIDGKTIDLTKDNIDDIGNIVIKHILDNIDLNINDEKEVQEFKNKLELEIIESLPNDIQAGSIVLNMEAIIEEINKFRGQI